MKRSKFSLPVTSPNATSAIKEQIKLAQQSNNEVKHNL